MDAAASLFTDQYLRSLGSTVATAGLIGVSPGPMQGFTQRLMTNAVRAVVKASVCSAIERRNFGEAMKGAGINALVDSISGTIAEKIGAASNAQSLPSVEHKLAHFALGCGMGAALGATNGSKDVLLSQG